MRLHSVWKKKRKVITSVCAQPIIEFSSTAEFKSGSVPLMNRLDELGPVQRTSDMAKAPKTCHMESYGRNKDIICVLKCLNGHMQ